MHRLTIVLILVSWHLYAGGTEPCANDISEGELVGDDEFEKLMIERIKTRLLRRLGMTEPPCVTKPVIPAFIMQQVALNGNRDFNYDDDEDDEDDDSQQITSPRNAAVPPKQVIVFPEVTNCFVLEEENPSSCFTIQFSAQDVLGIVESAELWVHTVNANSCQTTCNFRVTEEIAHSDHNESVLLDSIHTCNSSDWFKFNFSQAAQAWSHQYHRAHVIRISCMNCDSSVESLFSVEDNKKPTLIVHIVPQQELTRLKRSSNCSQSCCKQDFRVKFKDIGWDNWIISPEEYQASFCTGTCSNDPSILDYHHTLVMRRYIDSGGQNSSLIKVCCVAKKLKGIHIMYVNHAGTPELTLLRNMEVETCRCR